jgi:hypothetical protein
MSRARYWRHSSADTRGHLLTIEHAFLGQSVTWHNRRKYTLEERRALAYGFLLDMGWVHCQRCRRGWLDAELDAQAQQLGVSVVRIGEAKLELCPRCLLGERLLMVLAARLTTLQGR